MRLRFCGSGLGANSLSAARMDGPGRACWRGRSESVTRWRPAATRAGSRKPVAAARPPSPTDGATTRFSPEKQRLFGPAHQTRKRRQAESHFVAPEQSHFVPAPTLGNSKPLSSLHFGYQLEPMENRIMDGQNHGGPLKKASRRLRDQVSEGNPAPDFSNDSVR
jgi:hypothetical protein